MLSKAKCKASSGTTAEAATLYSLCILQCFTVVIAALQVAEILPRAAWPYVFIKNLKDVQAQFVVPCPFIGVSNGLCELAL